MPKYLIRAQKSECIRLRVEQQLSAPSIARLVKISNHSAYKILRDYPWIPRGPKAATRGIPWTAEQDSILRRMWPTAEREEIAAALGGRRFATIGKRATFLGVRRKSEAERKAKNVHPILRELRALRTKARMTRARMMAKTGYHVNDILKWELGRAQPRLFPIIDCFAVLGYELVIRPTAAKLLAEPTVLPDKKQLMGSRA